MNTFGFLGDFTASFFSIWFAVVLFTILSVFSGVLIKYAGWKALSAVSIFLFLTVLRGMLPIELTFAKVISFSKTISEQWHFLLYPRWGKVSIVGLLHIAWLIGIAVCLIVFAYKLLRQRKKIKALTKDATESVGELVTQLYATQRAGRSGKLYVSDQISTPMMVGFFQPIVLLPKTFTELPKAELQMILRHELAHFLYLDLWKKLGMHIVCCVFWWNPAAYYLCRTVIQTQELRADAYACAQAGEAERLRYADIMLGVLKAAHSKNYIAAGYFNRSGDRYIKQRFKEILREPAGKRHTIQAWIGVAMAVVLFCSSYLVIIQPIGYPQNNEMEYEARAEDTGDFIIDYGNGVYGYYHESARTNTLYGDEINKEIYKDIPIYQASIEYEEGD